MLELRSFTESDWDAFAGCETESPSIADYTVTNIGDHGHTGPGVIILDGNIIQIHVIINDENETEITYHKEFENENVAYVFACGMQDSYPEIYLVNSVNFSVC